MGFKPINPETASRGDSLHYLWLVLFLTLFRLAVLAVYFLLVLPISCFFDFVFQNFISRKRWKFSWHILLILFYSSIFFFSSALSFFISFCNYILFCVFVCRLFHSALLLFLCVYLSHLVSLHRELRYSNFNALSYCARIIFWHKSRSMRSGFAGWCQ